MPPLSGEEIRDVNVRYHDVAAQDYDAKWGIDYGQVGRDQVRGKLVKLLGDPPGHFGDSLELGAGTGYFSLNLLQDGIVSAATCTDISPGMVAALEANAKRLGLAVETAVAAADELPFADASFDLVLGHAILHHLPDLGAAFAEMHRVLRPGGTILFAGEPSSGGDRLARHPKRLASAVAPIWRRAMRARPAEEVAGPPSEHDHDHALESLVDVHAFVPSDLEAPARAAGFADVRVRGEELLANVFGWFNRTVEASAAPEDVPWLWRQYAFRGYLALQWIDAAVLEPRLPPARFYNLMLLARKPA